MTRAAFAGILPAMSEHPDTDPRPPFPLGAVIALVVATAALFVGRWWTAGLIERAMESSDALPGLAIMAIESLSGAGWFTTMGAVGAAFATVLGRQRDMSWTPIGVGLLLHFIAIRAAAGEFGFTGPGHTGAEIAAWSAGVWSPLLAVLLVWGAAEVMRQRLG